MKSLLIAFNFALFAGAIYTLLGPVISDFFYARAEALKKKMADAVVAIRIAEVRHKKASAKKQSLQNEIEDRKRTLEESTRLECEALFNEAVKHSEYIIESAHRAGLGELAKNEKEIRETLLEEAFAVAMKELYDDLKDKEAAGRVIERGVRGLSGFSGNA